MFPRPALWFSFRTVKGAAVWPRLMKASLTVQAGARTARCWQLGGGEMLPLSLAHRTPHSPFLLIWFVSSPAMLHSVQLHTNLSTPCPAAGVTCTAIFPHPRRQPTLGGRQPRVYSRGTAGNQAGRCVLSTNWSPARAHAVKPGKWRGGGVGEGKMPPPLPFPSIAHIAGPRCSLQAFSHTGSGPLLLAEPCHSRATTCRRTVGVTVCHIPFHHLNRGGGCGQLQPIKATQPST